MKDMEKKLGEIRRDIEANEREARENGIPMKTAEEGASLRASMKTVNQPQMKKDAMALVTGKPVFLDDVTGREYLVVKVLRSPHANAIVKKIDTDRAKKVPGVEGIFTWVDVPNQRFTMAGQTYPELSPYDRLILDPHVRYVGDPVAIVAGENEDCVDRALKLIRTEYQVLPAVLDMHEAKDNETLIHPEENWEALVPVGADNKRNLCASQKSGVGDVEEVLAQCDVVVEGTYHTQANQQAMMETFRTACYMDTYGRLNVVSSTQIVFHVQRIVARALDISQSKVRVTKHRIGGGFGAKQTVVAEVFPAFVTWKTGKPSKMIFTREECQTASTPRHEMEVKVRVGATREGRIRALDVYALSDTGAYGEHGPTTVGLVGQKGITLYGKLDAYRFDFDVVYTNHMSAGAYRGYGATQGIFAIESAVNELAQKLGIDPVKLREMNMVQQGQRMPSYENEPNRSCALDRCMARAKEMIGWDEKYPCKDMGNGKVRSVGVAMAMQGSCISFVDTGSAVVKLEQEGTYNLSVGSADMGTGCDTILAQIAAEVLACPLEQITVCAADTDSSPYDSGSYASSTTYVTGKAVEQAAGQVKELILKKAAQMMEAPLEELEFLGDRVAWSAGEKQVSIKEIADASTCGNHLAIVGSVTNSSPVSPPPFMVGMVEIELDKETGALEILDYVAVVDCGTPINPNLARVQTEGGLAQGIGMALYENVKSSGKGQILSNSLMQYKIPTRMDVPRFRVEFESSYEPTGPFGAKSIGEIVINTPAPALAHAIANATGVWFQELPITSEKIWRGMQ